MICKRSTEKFRVLWEESDVESGMSSRSMVEGWVVFRI